jgi:hypothetical protein
MQKEKVDELDRRWINAIIDGRPESEIRQYKKEYIKASEDYENAGYDVIRIGKEIGVEKFHPPPKRVRHYRKSAMYRIFFCKNQFKESEGH